MAGRALRLRSGQASAAKTRRIGLAQLNTTVGDLAGNLQLIRRSLDEARTAGCDLVAFPELALTGYPPEDLLLSPQFVQEAAHALHHLATHTHGLLAVVGCVDRGPRGTLFNAAAVFADGRLRGMYHKMRLPNYGVFDEQRYFTPGTRPLVAQWGSVRFGVNICEDIWHEDGPLLAQANAGARLIVNISSSPYHAGKLHERRQLIQRWTKRAHVHLAYVNLVGGQDELVFDGGSLIMDPRGRVLAQARSFEEELLVVDLPLGTRPSHRSSLRVRRAPVSVLRLPQQRSAPPPRAPLTSPLARALDPIEEIYQALVLGTRDYVRKNGFETVVLGLSGGIDSAVTALIAADALGCAQVVALSMPSQYSSAETQADAARLAERLGIRFWRIPIDAMLHTYLETLAPVVPHRPADVTEQNLQARIRGNVLMACSNKFGWLVLSTGNKSEVATGYCTLYGDMAGGFAVLKDVPKTLVYHLARQRNQRASRPLIPESIFTRTPTAELAPHQTDQEILPPYEVLDPILKAYIEEALSRRAITRRRFADDTVRRVISMVDRSEYKRRQGPPGIKITPRAFGKDRRMPITNRYRDGLVSSASSVQRQANGVSSGVQRLASPLLHANARRRTIRHAPNAERRTPNDNV